MSFLSPRFRPLVLCAALMVSGCNDTPDQTQSKKAAATDTSKPIVNKLKDQNGDMAFLSFINRLRQVVAAHDVDTLAGMMTTDFGYVLDPPREGAGVFQYWDEHNLWPELQEVIKERFVPFGDQTHVYMVAPPEFASAATTYTGYRAGVHLVNGSWRFAYFVNGQ
jgi:hypothetical protein